MIRNSFELCMIPYLRFFTVCQERQKSKPLVLSINISHVVAPSIDLANIINGSVCSFSTITLILLTNKLNVMLKENY